MNAVAYAHGYGSAAALAGYAIETAEEYGAPEARVQDLRDRLAAIIAGVDEAASSPAPTSPDRGDS